MLRRILLPIRDLNADQDALDLAWRRFPGAEVHLLHLIASSAHRVVASPEAALADMYLSELDLDAERAAHAGARSALHALGHQGGYEVVTTHDPASEILRRAPAFDLILIATRALRGLDRLLFGSVAQRVVLEAPVPVMTVRANQTDQPLEPEAALSVARRPLGAPDRTPFRKLLLIEDGSDTGRLAERYVREQFPGAALDITRTAPDPSPMVFAAHSPAAIALLHEHQSEWQRAQQEDRRAGRCQVRYVRGDPARVALRQLAQHPRPGQAYDLLVLGTQARGTLDRFLQGSVTGEVMRGAGVPVLTVRQVPARLKPPIPRAGVDDGLFLHSRPQPGTAGLR